MKLRSYTYSSFSPFTIAFSLIVAALNLIALCAAWLDRSWGALWIALIGAPVLNGILALGGLLCIIPLHIDKDPQFSLWRHGMISIGVPFSTAIIDIGVILAMDLGGC